MACDWGPPGQLELDGPTQKCRGSSGCYKSCRLAGGGWQGRWSLTVNELHFFKKIIWWQGVQRFFITQCQTW